MITQPIVNRFCCLAQFIGQQLNNQKRRHPIANIVKLRRLQKDPCCCISCSLLPILKVLEGVRAMPSKKQSASMLFMVTVDETPSAGPTFKQLAPTCMYQRCCIFHTGGLPRWLGSRREQKASCVPQPAIGRSAALPKWQASLPYRINPILPHSTLACLTLHYPALFYQTLLYPTLSSTTPPCPTLLYLSITYPILSYPTPSDPTLFSILHYPTLPCPIRPCPIHLYNIFIVCYIILCNLTLSCSILHYPILPYPTLSHHILPYLTYLIRAIFYTSYKILPYPTLPHPILPYPTLPVLS